MKQFFILPLFALIALSASAQDPQLEYVIPCPHPQSAVVDTMVVLFARHHCVVTLVNREAGVVHGELMEHARDLVAFSHVQVVADGREIRVLAYQLAATDGPRPTYRATEPELIRPLVDAIRSWAQASPIGP